MAWREGNGLGEISRFGKGGRERVEIFGVRFGKIVKRVAGEFDGARAVAERSVRAGGQQPGEGVADVGPIRGESLRGVEVGEAAEMVAARGPQRRALVVAHRIVRHKLDDAVEVVKGVLKPAERDQNLRSERVRTWVVRCPANGLVEIFQRGVEIAPRRRGAGAVEVAQRQIGTEPNGFGKVVDGVVKLAGAQAEPTATEMDARVFRIKVDGSRVVGERGVSAPWAS